MQQGKWNGCIRRGPPRSWPGGGEATLHYSLQKSPGTLVWLRTASCIYGPWGQYCLAAIGDGLGEFVPQVAMLVDVDEGKVRISQLIC